MELGRIWIEHRRQEQRTDSSSYAFTLLFLFPLRFCFLAVRKIDDGTGKKLAAIDIAFSNWSLQPLIRHHESNFEWDIDWIGRQVVYGGLHCKLYATACNKMKFSDIVNLCRGRICRRLQAG